MIHPIEVMKLMTENHTPLPDIPVRCRFLSRGALVIAPESAAAQIAAHASSTRHSTIAALVYRCHVSIARACLPISTEREIPETTQPSAL